MVTMSQKSSVPQSAKSVSQALMPDTFDPSATFGGHCGNGFDADFIPYQSRRLCR
jgi:hypothetical protein